MLIHSFRSSLRLTCLHTFKILNLTLSIHSFYVRPTDRPFLLRIKNRLLPRVVSGSSAGSIMAAILGTHTDDEMLEMVASGRGFRTDFIRPTAKTRASPVFRYFSGGTQI